MNYFHLGLCLFLLILSAWLTVKVSDGLGITFTIVLALVITVAIFGNTGKTTYVDTNVFLISKTPNGIVLSVDDTDILMSDLKTFINADKIKGVRIGTQRNAFGVIVKDKAYIPIY